MFYFDNSYTAHLAPNCLEAPWGRHIVFLQPNHIRYINNLELVCALPLCVILKAKRPNPNIASLTMRGQFREQFLENMVYFVKMTRARFCFLWCKYLSYDFVAILLRINPVPSLCIK